jgi:hypothetical protein
VGYGYSGQINGGGIRDVAAFLIFAGLFEGLCVLFSRWM